MNIFSSLMNITFCSGPSYFVSFNVSQAWFRTRWPHWSMSLFRGQNWLCVEADPTCVHPELLKKDHAFLSLQTLNMNSGLYLQWIFSFWPQVSPSSHLLLGLLDDCLFPPGLDSPQTLSLSSYLAHGHPSQPGSKPSISRTPAPRLSDCAFQLNFYV